MNKARKAMVIGLASVLAAAAAGGCLAVFYYKADFSLGASFNAKGLARYLSVDTEVWENPEGFSNPIYPVAGMEEADYSVKDACLVYKDGKPHIFASAFYEDRGIVRSHVIAATGDSLDTLEAPYLNWSGEDIGAKGLASPQVTLIDGVYYMTYNTWGDLEGSPNQLFYAVSTDLISWETHKPLAKNLTEGIRSIDVCAEKIDGHIYLIYKEVQTTVFACGESMNGDFVKVKNKTFGWYENYQLFMDNEALYAVATDREHEPVLLKHAGDKITPETYGQFVPVKKILPKEQGFNTHHRANAASLTHYDGKYMLLYAGNTENSSHAGRGNNKLGIAVSDRLPE